MNNVEISKFFEETARALDYVAAEPEIVAQFAEVARRVGALDVPLEVFANASESQRSAAELARVLKTFFSDVNSELVVEIRELIATGTTRLRQELEREVSPAAFRLLRLKSLEPDDVLFLREVMGIRDVATLRIAAQRGDLSGSEFFWPEQESEILSEIQRREEERVLRRNAEPSSSEKASDAEIFAFSAADSELAVDDAGTMFLANADALGSFVVQALENGFKKAGTRQPNEMFNDAARDANNLAFFAQIAEFGRRIWRFLASSSKSSASPTESRANDFSGGVVQKNVAGRDFFRPWTRIEKVGALARRDDRVAQLDFLLETDAPERAFEAVKTAPFVRTVLKETSRFLVVELDGSAFDLPFNGRPTPNAALRFVASSKLAFGARELATTATPEHWRALRERAEQRGWNLTSFGLYDGPTRIASRTPERVYERLQIPFVPADLRTNRVEWSWIDAGTPDLTTLDDLRGDMHMHTTFSDGTGDFDEMVAEARRLGLDYIALTDHTQNVKPIVNGMDDAELLRYWSLIDELNRKLQDSGVDFRVLKGVEVDILSDGRLDLKDETLARADWVVASVHFGSDDSSRRLRRRYLAALRHPAVDVVAHPTGRTIGTKGPMKIDVEFLCETAAEYGKFLELNAQPRRLDLDVDGLIAAKKAGVPIVISTDAHSPSHLEYLRFGVEQARRAGLTRADVANARPLTELLRWRDERRANAPAFAK